MQRPKMFYGAPPYIFEKARELRKTMTSTERILWQRLKKKQLRGYKFRRQHPIATYVVDFYCHSVKLVVELDGGFHNLKEQKHQDQKRSDDLNGFGITVIRFTNDQVIQDIEGELKSIGACLP